MEKYKVVVCGQKKLCKGCLEILYGSAHMDLMAVVASTNDWEENIPEFCFEKKIKCYVGNINSYVKEIKAMKPDIIFSFQARELFKKEILNIPKIGCINLHFGRLPDYAGCYPIAHAILNKEEKIHSTLHYMTENFDEGGAIREWAIWNNKKNLNTFLSAEKAYNEITEISIRGFENFIKDIGDSSYPFEGVKYKYTTEGFYNNSKSIDFEKDCIINNLFGDNDDLMAKIAAFSFPRFQYPKVKINEELFDVVDYTKKENGDLFFTVKVEGE